MRRRYTEKERGQLIEAVCSSGQTTRAAAERLGVSVSTAYLWMKRAPTAKPPRFARLLRSSEGATGSLRIEIAGATIRIDKGFDSELLLEVVAVLGRVSG